MTFHKYQVKAEQSGRATKGASLYDSYADVGDQFVAPSGLAPTEDEQERGYNRENYPMWDRLEVVEEDVSADDLDSLDVPYGGALPRDADERDEPRQYTAADVLSARDRTMKGRGVSEEQGENLDLDEEDAAYDTSVPDEGRPFEGETTDPSEQSSGESGN